MDVESKIKEDMKKLGCCSDMKIALAYHLYIHLVDEKLMYDTEYCYNKDIDTLYVVARPNKDDKMNIYVPIRTQDDVTIELINKLQENLCTVETGPTINLAFIEGDFTTVFYTFTSGIVEKSAPEKIAQQRAKTEKRNFINNELRKSKKEILNNAFNGGFVEEDDCEFVG